jgi:uncharacterized protein YaiE (UPF0345 family)
MQKRLLALVLLFAFTQINAQKKEWISLFDGKTTSGWHTYGKDAAGEAWKVIDGALMLDPTNKQGWQIKGGGDIVTNESYGDFHLQLEWKISQKGNSGIIFFVQDEPKKYNYIWYTGPEMQVLDNDGHGDGKIFNHRAGNLYDLIAGPEGVVKPVGEWNQAEIVSYRGKLDFYLNGVNVVSTTYGDDAWRKMLANSKFKTMPDFGKVFSGHIALQDHGDNVWYKNIMVKKL